jgi:hypothetical protein
MMKAPERFGLHAEALWQALESVDHCPAEPVHVRAGSWTVTLFPYVVLDEGDITTRAVLRAPYVNSGGLRFALWHRDRATWVRRSSHLERLAVEEPELTVTANDGALFGLFHGRPPLRRSLPAECAFLTLDEDAGWYGQSLARDADEFVACWAAPLESRDELRRFWEFFSAVMDELCHLDPAYYDGAAFHTEALLHHAFSAANPEKRQQAAEALGRMAHPAATRALVQALREPYSEIRAAAAGALARIGDPQAVSPLLGCLGLEIVAQGGRIRAEAPVASALAALGASAHLEALEAVLSGSGEAALGHLGRCPALLHVLARTLDAPQPLIAIRVAETLAAARATDTLPALRQALRAAGSSRPTVRKALERAIRELERLAALPRPASSPQPDAYRLPRAPGE